MLQAGRDVQAEGQPRLSVHLARSSSEIREAQRLRFRVFGEEMGARLSGAEPGLDEDAFDPYCDHLVVTDEDTGEVVGTYRILSGLTAKRLGGFYSDQEFDLSRLAPSIAAAR
jgi:putative hemolysin